MRMAEIWPRLRKKLQQGKKATKSSSSKSVRKGSKGASNNPFATIGLEKFTTILEELQSKQQGSTSLVERTASSLSAARCISRSAQEWTASTLVRAATRCSPDSTKDLQCASSIVAPTAPVGELQIDLENSCEAPTVPAEELQRDSEELSEDRQAEGCQKEVSTSNSRLPLGVRLPTRRWRSMASKSAFVMLVALGAFLSARAGRVGKPFAAILSFSVVVRIWRKGKVSARFMFSSMALYFLTPLRSYLITRIPKRLILVPQNPETSQSVESEVAQPELPEKLGFPVVAPSLLPIPESSSSSESLNPVRLPNAKNVGGSPSRKLAKKISSGLKKLKMLRSSSSSVSVVGVSESSSSSSHAPSSPKSSSASSHRRMCPFSRKTGDIAEASDDTTSSSHDGSRGKSRLLRRHQSAEIMSYTSSTKGSRCGRKLSSETLEHYNHVGEECSIASSSAYESTRSTSSSSASSKHEAAPVAWPMVGLLVTLLFLVMGRVPAIMATSLFFVVVSPHSRARDRRESRAYREAAARKLHHSPPSPRGGRQALGSPPRSF